MRVIQIYKLTFNIYFKSIVLQSQANYDDNKKNVASNVQVGDI